MSKEKLLAAIQPVNRSRRILSGRGEDESISRARTVMASFERVWGSTQQAAPDHLRHKQALHLFFEHLKAYTDAFGELSMDVSPHALSIDGQPILKFERKKDHYIHCLFRDDIRQLVFYPELTEDELMRFLDILRTDFSDPAFLEDDIVTLLWHENLSGIGYSVFDTLEDGGAEDGETGFETAGCLRSETDRRRDVTGALELSVEPGPMDADDVMALAMSKQPIATSSVPASAGDDLPVTLSAGDKRMREFAPGGDASASQETNPTFQLTPQQAKALRDQLRACEAVVPAKFGEILMHLLQELPEHHHTPILQSFEDFVLASLSLASEASLVQTLNAMASLGHTAEGGTLYQQLIGTIQNHKVIDVLMQRLETSALSEDLFNLVKAIGNDSFPVLWERLQTLPPTETRQTLLSLLRSFAPNHLSFLLQHVSHSHEDIALQALSLLKEVPLSNIVQELLNGLRHPSTAVRFEIASLVQQVSDPTVQQTLPKMLNDAEEQVRLAVIQLLIETESPGAEQALVAAICHPDFSRRNPEEKRRTLSALGRAATHEGLALLRSVACDTATSPVKGDQEAQIAAIRALASRADHEVLPALQKLAKTWFGNKELKRTARFAVAVINRQGGKP